MIVYSFAPSLQGLDWLLIVVGLLGSGTFGATMPVFFIYFGDTLNSLGNPGANLSSEMLRLVYTFLVIAAIALVACYLAVSCWVTVGVRASNRIRTKVLNAILAQDMTFFDTQGSAGALLSILNESVNTMQDGIGEKVSNFAMNICTFIIALVIAFTYSWDMTLVIMSVLPVMAVTGFLISNLISWSETKGADAYRKSGGVANETLANMKTIAAFNAQQVMTKNYTAFLDPPKKFQIKQQWASGFVIGMTNMTFFGLFALALWYGARRVSDGGLNPGTVMTVLFNAVIGGFVLGMAMPSLANFKKASAAGGPIFAILEREPVISQLSKDGLQPDTVEGEVIFDNVAFRYPSRPDAQVFASFSLTIPAGKSVALVGESGSGKSTTIQLLQRFYDPAEGEIRLDGNPLPTLNVRWLRMHIGLVAQEPTLFATSILENVRFGLPGASEKEVIQALKSANAWKFVKSLPEGLLTNVGHKGLQMSGGQKQRLAIARAIIKSPQVLLLDEATSALDAGSEKVVQRALDSVMENRTTVIVAHRLSTIKGADKIAVVSAGAIVEEGTHDELSARGGHYATLIKAQQSTASDRTIVSRKSLDDAVDAAVREAGDDEDDDQVIIRSSSKEDKVAVKKGCCGKPATKGDGDDLPANGEKTKKEKTGVPLGRVWAESEGAKIYLFPALIVSCVNGSVMPLFGYFLSFILTALFKPKDEIEAAVQLWVILFAVVGAGAWIMQALQSGFLGVIGATLARRLRGKMFAAMVRQDQGWFDLPENGLGRLTQELSTETYYVKGALTDNVAVIVQNLATLGVAYGLAASSSWKVALVVTATFPLLGIVGAFQVAFMSGFDIGASKAYAVANAHASDSITNVRVVQSFALVDEISALYRAAMVEPTRGSIKKAQVMGIGFGFSNAYIFLMWALGFWYSSTLIDSGERTFDEVMKALFVLILAGQGFQQAQMAFPDLGKAAAATIRVFKTIDRVPPIDPYAPGEEPESVSGTLQLTEVVFRYPARPAITVLNGLSLTVPAGESVALVGESGCGKSTIIGLVQRWYDPEIGTVSLDGRDIRGLAVRWLRNQMALVQQEPVLFSGSIASNIAFGMEDMDGIDAIKAAAVMANAANFIEGFPEGYDTQVGEGGVQLSGGQKQRIAIARAMMRNPKILLLDEATSALDTESERIVQEALDQVVGGRTTIIIAHRLSTVKNADKISVVQGGVIVEEGNHSELIAKEGAYKNLVRLQTGN